MTAANLDDFSVLSDAQLIQLCWQGDQSAFGQLVERYQTLVCSVAYNRCGDLDFSEDLAQEAFILAWQKRVELKDGSKFRSWICTIVRNLANRSLQRKGRSVIGTATHLDALPEVAADTDSPVERAVSAEEETLVWQALAEVPDNYREPLILFYREEQSVSRVAEALELSEDAVKQRLSRGRKMLQLRLTATIESVLAKSKPSKAFTGAVLLGLASWKTNAAAAAGITQGAATVAKTAASSGSAVSGLGSLFVWPILQLPVLTWLYKTSFAEMRTSQERQLLRRFLFGTHCGLVVFAAAAFSGIWWQHHVQPIWLRGLIIPAMMVAFMIPMVIFGRRLGKQIERMRLAEGASIRPRPLIESASHRRHASKIYTIFCLSGLLVMVWPAVLPLMAGDWIVLAAMLALAILVSLISAQLCLRHSKWAFKLYSASLSVPSLVAIAIIVWRGALWKSAFSNYLPWLVGTLQAMAMTVTILSMIAWKRVHGRRD